VRKPYIGITGFMSLSDALRVLGAVPANTKRLVMVGVLASLKTMRGIQNKWPNRYPAMDKIADIFPNHPLSLNLIHYNTKEKDTLGDQLVAMTEFGGANLHGFQLNIAWPDLATLNEYKRAYPTKQIVLQIGGHAFEMVNHSPEQLATKVAEYDGIVEYVLLDPSGGYGKPFDPTLARNYLLALKSQNLGMGLGVAGGLSPTTLDLVEPLAREFPDLNIDAEGRLRTPEDHLDLAVSSEYLRKAFAMFDGD
jgi:hypothetical protein